VYLITEMMEIIKEIGLALLFGIGVSFGTLGLCLLYRIYITSQNYDSPLVITAIASILIWIGATCFFFVIA